MTTVNTSKRQRRELGSKDIAYRGPLRPRVGERQSRIVGRRGGSEGGSGTHSRSSSGAPLCTASSSAVLTEKEQSAPKIAFQCFSLGSPYEKSITLTVKKVHKSKVIAVPKSG